MRAIVPEVYTNIVCKLWQYGQWSFQTGGTKLERLKHTQRKLLKFENWVSGEVSKIGHHFRKLSDLRINVIKKCQKKIEKDSDNF